MTQSVTYTDPARVLEITQAPASEWRTQSGYGTFPTRHRVYALCYGNSASLAIKVNGDMVFIDHDTSHKLFH
jgi:hypothetical protein